MSPVNLTKVPQYASYNTSGKAFIRQRIVEFNTAYANRLNQIKATSPGLNIVMPDIFALLDDVEANAFKYGLTNVLDDTTNVTDVLENLPSNQLALNGPGTNYIWWGLVAPSARFHEVIADTAQQALSPSSITCITPVNTSNQLTLASAPVGMKGTVEFITDLSQTNWQTNSVFTVSNTTQTVFVNPTNSMRFYRVKFPWQWSWP